MRLSADIYDQIIAALKSDSQRAKDKRREPRVGLAGEADYVTVDEKGKRIAGALRVRDVSPSGIGLVSTCQMAKNQRFVVQLYTSQDEPVWLVCLTAYCRKVDGGFFSVGARISQLLRAADIQKVEAQAPAPEQKPARIPVAAHADMSDIERISKAILS